MATTDLCFSNLTLYTLKKAIFLDTTCEILLVSSNDDNSHTNLEKVSFLFDMYKFLLFYHSVLCNLGKITCNVYTYLYIERCFELNTSQTQN